MPFSDLALRFTDTQYATQADVSKALQTAVIDPIWDEIMRYRHAFSFQLGLETIVKKPFTLTLTPALLSHVNKVETRLLKAMGMLAHQQLLFSLPDDPHFLSPLISGFAKLKQIQLQPSHIEAIMHHPEVEATLLPLKKWYALTSSLATTRGQSLSEEVIHPWLVHLYESEDLPFFYREKEVDVLPRSLVDTVYYAAPVNRIETMMNSLYRLVGSDSFSPIITACISHFYIHYVKPFPLDDPFFPAFIMKYIFIQKGYEATPVSFPIDTFLLEPSTASLFQTVQKTLDLTYWLIALLKNLELHLDAFFTYFDQQTATHIKHEKKVTVATSQALVAASLPAMQQQTLAEQLLYKHPSLKKQMAAFYASHHEPGQFYTISQFRDFANCAYETARTSMEHLVVLGYYRKEPYKNKFLYTPNPQGVAL